LTTPHGHRYAVIYDSACGVCRAFVARLAAWDSARILEILPSQSGEIPSRFPWISPAAFEESVQVVRLSDGKTWQGAAAIEELLNALPKGKSVSWLFHIPLVRGIAERCYRAFARNRYRLGCEDHCRTE
jgi:predicted DCC family thiol-disulfide oxidoreductase YuxK